MVTGRATTAATFVALLLILASACGGNGADPTTTPTPPTTSGPVQTSASPAPSPASTPDPNAEPPKRDLIDLARRYRGVSADSPRLARDAPYGYAIGDSEEFHVLELSGPSVRTIGASVRHITEHAYFFVEDGTSVGRGTIEQIGSDFENIVYPTVRARFGSEWTPGVDSDPRITILHASIDAGGYFSGGDEFAAAIAPRSNEREVLYLDSGILGSSGVAYNGLVAHELQHMVHWQADDSEDSWANEGLSQVAAEEVGGGHDWLGTFLAEPDTQLTFWPEYESAAIHYAAAELFMGYLLDHYGGRERASELLAKDGDSIRGVQAFLDGFGAKFNDVFADWVVANYLDLDNGPYSHTSTDATTGATSRVGSGSGEGEVGQFAADYLEAGASGTFTFDGADEVSLGVPLGGGAFWWANRGDSINTRLTREFDLSSLTSATLNFSTWYEIEYGWDYAYVAVSTDGGKTWTALPGTTTTDFDPVGAAYGQGYTGSSGGWVEETVNLDPYAGQKLLVRFEYVTDDATSLTGWAIDNVEIPQLAFRDGVENADAWTAEGFQHIERPLAQRFIVQVIRDEQVTRLELDATNRGQVALDGSETVVVSGITEGTAEKAPYTWLITP